MGSTQESRTRRFTRHRSPLERPRSTAPLSEDQSKRRVQEKDVRKEAKEPARSRKEPGAMEEGDALTGHSEQEEGGHQEMDDVSVQNQSTTLLQGFPGSSAGKESACNAGDPSSIPEWGRSAGEGIGDPLQYSWAFLWLRW